MNNGSVFTVQADASAVLLLLSGGIDSTLCARHYKGLGCAVTALFIDYGQPAALLEYTAALRIAEHFLIPIQRIVVDGLNSPYGKIQGRNAALLSLALVSLRHKSALISLGIHAGTQYEDCSPAFLRSMQQVFDLYTDGRVRVDAPLIGMTKPEIVSLAQRYELPIEFTYSCEAGTEPVCGICPSCRDRAQFTFR